MEKARKFAKKFKSLGVKISRCDDYVNTSSTILYIPHKNDHEYCGTTMIVIPQLEKPAIVFLYPNHHAEMLKVLAEINEDCWFLKGIES